MAGDTPGNTTAFIAFRAHSSFVTRVPSKRADRRDEDGGDDEPLEVSHGHSLFFVHVQCVRARSRSTFTSL